MRTIILLFILLCCSTPYSTAQNDYIVSTPSDQEFPATSQEEQFIDKNFPLHPLCKWTPGMKFMFVLTDREMYLPTLLKYETDRGADNGSLKYKILTFTGTEERSQTAGSDINYSTRYIFEFEGEKFYYEFRNMRLSEICEKNPYARINGLLYLNDIDKAKKLLMGKTVYVQSETARVDDKNSYSGYRDVAISANTQATITAIGIGNSTFPVKIVFRDTSGHSYYLEVALSRTNSGMDLNAFEGGDRIKYFPNAFSFTDKKAGSIDVLKNKYLGATVYLKKTLLAQRSLSLEGEEVNSQSRLPRYMVMTIDEIKVKSPGTKATIYLKDKDKSVYEIEADLKYDVITRNENFIEDLLGFEDIHKKYPGITEKRWQIISRGDLEIGMSTDECRLSIGDPIEIELRKDSRFEIWFYNGRALEFENGTLRRF